MESIFLKIQPKLDPSDAKKLENDLNKRFQNVAKRFSSGLGNAAGALKNGISTGLKALAGGSLLAILLNPLDNVLNRIDAVLRTADDLDVMAKDLNIDPATLKNLENVFKVYGVSQEDFLQMMTRFETLLGQAKTGEDQTLSNYAKMGTADAFNKALKAISSIQDPAERQSMVANIFGLKKSAKMTELLQNPKDADALLARVGVQNPEQFNKDVAKAAVVEQYAREQEVISSNIAFQRDMLNISNQTVNVLTELQRQRDVNTSKNIKNVESLAAIQKTMDEVQQLLMDVMGPILKEIVPFLPKLAQVITALAEMTSAVLAQVIGFFKNAARWFGGGKNK